MFPCLGDKVPPLAESSDASLEYKGVRFCSSFWKYSRSAALKDSLSVKSAPTEHLNRDPDLLQRKINFN